MEGFKEIKSVRLIIPEDRRLSRSFKDRISHINKTDKSSNNNNNNNNNNNDNNEMSVSRHQASSQTTAGRKDQRIR